MLFRSLTVIENDQIKQKLSDVKLKKEKLEKKSQTYNKITLKIHGSEQKKLEKISQKEDKENELNIMLASDKKFKKLKIEIENFPIIKKRKALLDKILPKYEIKKIKMNQQKDLESKISKYVKSKEILSKQLSEYKKIDNEIESEIGRAHV